MKPHVIYNDDICKFVYLMVIKIIIIIKRKCWEFQMICFITSWVVVWYLYEFLIVDVILTQLLHLCIDVLSLIEF
jgi:hypothetical protein